LLYQPLPDCYDGIAEVKSERVKSEKYNNGVYDLTGRKVNSQQQKGIVIKEGKKFIRP
jgi:hypothetical protein